MREEKLKNGRLRDGGLEESAIDELQFHLFEYLNARVDEGRQADDGVVLNCFNFVLLAQFHRHQVLAFLQLLLEDLERGQSWLHVFHQKLQKLKHKQVVPILNRLLHQVAGPLGNRRNCFLI